MHVWEHMNLINDLGTDLALAFLVEQRYRQKIDSEEALALISQVRVLLESASSDETDPDHTYPERKSRISSAH